MHSENFILLSCSSSVAISSEKNQTKSADPLPTDVAQKSLDSSRERTALGRDDPPSQGFTDHTSYERVRSLQERFAQLGHRLVSEPDAPEGCTWFLLVRRKGGTAIVRSIEDAEAIVTTMDGASNSRKHGRRWWVEID